MNILTNETVKKKIETPPRPSGLKAVSRILHHIHLCLIYEAIMRHIRDKYEAIMKQITLIFSKMKR